MFLDVYEDLDGYMVAVDGRPWPVEVTKRAGRIRGYVRTYVQLQTVNTAI